MTTMELSLMFIADGEQCHLSKSLANYLGVLFEGILDYLRSQVIKQLISNRLK